MDVGGVDRGVLDRGTGRDGVARPGGGSNDERLAAARSRLARQRDLVAALTERGDALLLPLAVRVLQEIAVAVASAEAAAARRARAVASPPPA